MKCRFLLAIASWNVILGCQSLYYINNIVADLLASANNFHVQHTALIRIGTRLDIADVLVAELVAQSVHLILLIIGAVHIGGCQVVFPQELHHQVHTLVRKRQHLIDVLLLHIDELNIHLMTAHHTASHLVAGIGKTLQFVGHLENRTYTRQGTGRKLALVQIIQVTVDLQFQTVGNLLVFLNA